MTSHPPDQGHPSTTSREDGPFVLRSLLEDVPLSADGSQSDVKINCVEYYGSYSASIQLSSHHPVLTVFFL